MIQAEDARSLAGTPALHRQGLRRRTDLSVQPQQYIPAHTLILRGSPKLCCPVTQPHYECNYVLYVLAVLLEARLKCKSSGPASTHQKARQDTLTRLLSGILFYFLGFWILLHYHEAQQVYVIPNGCHQ